MSNGWYVCSAYHKGSQCSNHEDGMRCHKDHLKHFKNHHNPQDQENWVKLTKKVTDDVARQLLGDEIFERRSNKLLTGGKATIRRHASFSVKSNQFLPSTMKNSTASSVQDQATDGVDPDLQAAINDSGAKLPTEAIAGKDIREVAAYIARYLYYHVSGDRQLAWKDVAGLMKKEFNVEYPADDAGVDDEAGADNKTGVDDKVGVDDKAGGEKCQPKTKKRKRTDDEGDATYKPNRQPKKVKMEDLVEEAVQEEIKKENEQFEAALEEFAERTNWQPEAVSEERARARENWRLC